MEARPENERGRGVIVNRLIIKATTFIAVSDPNLDSNIFR